MPQIQRTNQSKAELVTSDSIPFRQRLMDLFRAQDYVLVKNIDDEPFEWQYMPSDGEESYINDDNTQITNGRPSFNKDYSRMTGGNEQFWGIEPGETEVLLGENAYLFIEGVYKRVVAKKLINKTPDQPKGVARSFNWGADANAQKDLINQIFLGIKTPNFNDIPTVDTVNEKPIRTATAK